MLLVAKHHSGHHHRTESRRRRKYPLGTPLLQTHAWGQADDAGRGPPRSGRPRRQPREASERPGHRARRTPFRPSYWPSGPPGGHLSAGLIGVTADEHWVIRRGPTYALLLIGNGPLPAPSPCGTETRGRGYGGRGPGRAGGPGPGAGTARTALGIPAGAGRARTTSAVPAGVAGSRRSRRIRGAGAEERPRAGTSPGGPGQASGWAAGPAGHGAVGRQPRRNARSDAGPGHSRRPGRAGMSGTATTIEKAAATQDVSRRLAYPLTLLPGVQ